MNAAGRHERLRLQGVEGHVLPGDLKDDGMLGFYASKFPTVEINNTFYRLPKEDVLQDWASQVPEPFTFAIKASQRITHFARLKPECGERRRVSAQEHVDARRPSSGRFSFSCRRTCRRTSTGCARFSTLLPPDRRFTIEFRHESWFDDDVFDALRERDIALCVTEQADFASPVVSTASWGYVRLHRFDYDEPCSLTWRCGSPRRRGPRRTCSSSTITSTVRVRWRWSGL